ncbi:MAG: peptide chain release factor N(5)-glutamine methyltransferase [Rickettsiaceae bacterium]|nr:peptide chain release factor N(5)-glutamine methyltransferase [Rickettsiaceae bacterium]
MYIKEALELASNELKKSSTPSLDARLLLGFAINMTHEQLLLNYNKPLSKAEQNIFLQLVSRRQAMEPIAYILGKQEFYGLDFVVNENVLIPRPDTELLIDVMLDDYKKNFRNKEVSILELGSGSGAISITLAKEISSAKITALDISEKALEVSRQNAEIYNVSNKIEFIQSNWYGALETNYYDYIISNPPYISFQEQDEMSEETILFEPEIALYAQDDGLCDYKIIIAAAHQYLKPKGKLLLEMGYTQKDSLSYVLKQNNFNTLNVYNDLSDHARVIVAEF